MSHTAVLSESETMGAGLLGGWQVGIVVVSKGNVNQEVAGDPFRHDLGCTLSQPTNIPVPVPPSGGFSK